MKSFTIFFLLTLISCATHHRPASSAPPGVAHDTIASGNVNVSATRKMKQQDVCFNISLSLKGVPREDALPSNWSLAWIDQSNQYHLLSHRQRDPASIPKAIRAAPQFAGEQTEWKNSFQTCAQQVKLSDVKGIVLIPKNLPFENKRSLQLNWN